MKKMDKDNKPTPNLCSQGERIYTSPDQNSEALLIAHAVFCSQCAKAIRLLAYDTIHARPIIEVGNGEFEH